MREWIYKNERLLVLLWGLILFVPFLGAVHLFDWDEVNFAESAREMLVSGNFQKVQINFLPFMEKPPLFFWLQAASMKVFGVNEFAARLPNALVGIITLLLIFNIGKRWYSAEFGFFWVLMVTGSITPHLYYKTGIIDPLYNLFIFASVYQLFLYRLAKKTLHAIFLGVFLGLAIITKGPVAVVVLVLCFVAYWALLKFKRFFEWKHLGYSAFFALLVSALWFGIETLKSGPVFLLEFLKYQADLFLNPVAGHGQPFWYHPLVLLLGCFPASVFALPLLLNRTPEAEKSPADQLFTFMQLLFWVVLILFSIVETKIVHYSSLCYLPLTFMAAQFVYKWKQAQTRIRGYQVVLFACIAMVLSLVLLFIPQIDQFKARLVPYIKDPFAVASLSVNGGWQGYEVIPGILFLLASLFFVGMIIRWRVYKASLRFLLFSSILIPSLLIILAPRIEKYSQGPAIAFFESLQGKDVYIETLGYKSYAQYFYGRTPMHANPASKDLNWLISGPTDKDAYFSLHVNHIDGHVNEQMKEIGRSGGFVFYYRPAADSSLKTIIKP